MKTGFRGTFVISWAQTDIDGLDGAPIDALNVGAAWSWRGEAVRVDGPNDLLQLENAKDSAEIRCRAARRVRGLIGAAIRDRDDFAEAEIDDPLMDSSFVLTNGARRYTVTVIGVGPGRAPLLMFLDDMPPRDTDLWVVDHSLTRAPGDPLEPAGFSARAGVICFTPGTRISTPDGPRVVEGLREGDRVLTRDNGPQQVLWTGRRRMSGARLFVMPRLRPIRFHAGALGIERPDQEFLVSPDHRMLLRGPAAQALFNTSEVLVAASELVNGSTITVDLAVREVTYVHVLLPSHQVIWANGVETESFHPASADLAALTDRDRGQLLHQIPGLDRDPGRYGGYARRNLTASEAAILRYELAA